jgi:hypothetical protein
LSRTSAWAAGASCNGCRRHSGSWPRCRGRTVPIGRAKATLRDALDLRGSRDFEDVAAYQALLAETIGRRNARRSAEVALELAVMKALPKFKTTDFTLVSATVTSSGTIRVRGALYTVPSRLVGTRLKVHIYDDRLVCFLGATEVLRLRRVHRGKRGSPRVSVVDYPLRTKSPQLRPLQQAKCSADRFEVRFW